MTEEVIPFPFSIKDWRNYHVGLFEDEASSTAENGVQETVDKLLKLLPSLKKSTKLLVLSTDVGSSAVYIAAKVGCKVECVCRTKAGAKSTVDLAQAAGVEDLVNVVIYKYDEIPYSHLTFDFVLALDSLSKAEDKQHVFREVARMLVPEGRFAFTDYTAGLASDEESNTRICKLLSRDSIVLSRDYQQLADRADLEKVIVKDLNSSLAKHYDHLAKEVDAKSKKVVTALSQAVSELELGWSMYIFQKRND